MKMGRVGKRERSWLLRKDMRREGRVGRKSEGKLSTRKKSEGRASTRKKSEGQANTR